MSCAAKPVPALLALLLATLAMPGVHAAQTATVSGTPPLYSGPGTEYAPTGKTLPAGATVTLERCSTDLAGGSSTAGLIQPTPGAGDWCLVRGAGWVAAGGLVNISADPDDLLGVEGRDPLKDALGETTPAWDDFTDPDE